MAKKKTTKGKKNVKKFLGDVIPENCFWVNNGPIVKNVEGLLGALKRMSDKTFGHHVNEAKNDFSNWVNEVIGDKSLATALKKARTKPSAIKALEKRIKELKR